MLKLILMMSSAELAELLTDFLKKSLLFACLHFYGGNLIFINVSSGEVWQLKTLQTRYFFFFIYFSLVKVITMLTAA